MPDWPEWEVNRFGKDATPDVETENVTTIIAAPPEDQGRPRVFVEDPLATQEDQKVGWAQKDDQLSHIGCGGKGAKECLKGGNEYDKSGGKRGKDQRGSNSNWLGSA